MSDLVAECLRPIPCAICGGAVGIVSRTTADPEAPEMVRPTGSAWIGFVKGDHAPEMVVVCSCACLNTLFGVGS